MEIELRTLIKTKADNVFWGVAPREAPFPRVTIQHVSKLYQNDITNGPFKQLQISTVQIDVWALSFEEVVTLAKSIEQFDGYEGASGEVITNLIFQSKRADVDKTTGQDIHRVMFEVAVYHAE